MTRLDQALVERGLCDSRERAKRAVLAGQVRVNGHPANKASDAIKPADDVTLTAAEKYVSRGGHKLEHALNHFAVDVTGLTVLDLGASTGGFTDCLLQRGAAKVAELFGVNLHGHAQNGRSLEHPLHLSRSESHALAERIHCVGQTLRDQTGQHLAADRFDVPVLVAGELRRQGVSTQKRRADSHRPHPSKRARHPKLPGLCRQIEAVAGLDLNRGDALGHQRIQPG
jgi:ribosomal protein S4